MDLDPRHSTRSKDVAFLRMLRSVVENANDSVVITEAAPLEEPGPRIVYVNDSFTRQTGYAKHEVLGRSPRMLQGPDTDARARAELREALRLGLSFRGEILNYRKDGSQYWVEVSVNPVRDDNGVITHWTSVQRDVTARRAAAEEALRRERITTGRRESERARRRLEEILDAMEDAFVVLDDTWRVTFANRVAERLLGASRQEIVGAVPWPRLSDLLGDEARTLLERCKRQGIVVEGELSKRASLSCYLLRASPTDGGVSFFLHDVAGRRMAREIERRLMAIIEATPDLISSAELDGRLRYLNRAGYALLGIPEGTPPGSIRIEDAHPDWAFSTITTEAVPTAVHRGSWTGETAVRRRDGRVVPVSQVLIAHPDDDGRPLYLSTIVRDISETKQVELDQRFLAESSRVLNSDLDRARTIERAADIVIPRLGDWSLIVTRDETTGRIDSSGSHVAPNQKHLVEQLARFPLGARLPLGIESVLDGGEPTIVSEMTDEWLAISTPDDEDLRTLRSLSPTCLAILPLAAYGRMMGAMVLGISTETRRFDPRDTALAKEMALRLAMTLTNVQSYEQAVLATKARDDLLAVVSHDLRNPLSTVELAVALLREKLWSCQSPTEIESDLDRIERSLARARRLTEDLLDATRAEAGRLDLVLSAQDPAEIAREALDMQGDVARRNDLVLRGAIDPDLPPIEADRHRLLQVLSNLLDNAVRHTPAGGHISLAVRPSRRGVMFSVEDTGSGMSPEDLAHAFDRFWKAGAETSVGVGLGLPISKGIVEAHGGRIWIESERGRGTGVHFRLPAATPSPEPASTPR